MSASVKSVTITGYDGLLVDIECNLSNNLPQIVIVGFANKAVQEAKERLRGAFANAHLELPRRRITLNLAPADLPKADSGFDLALAVSILLASGQIAPAAIHRKAFIGELGLEGHTRGVRGVIGKLLAARQLGITEFYLPLANVAQAQLVPGIRLWPVVNLQDLYRQFRGELQLQPVDTGAGLVALAPADKLAGNPFEEVVGQAQAKRALAIAAAGGHNVFLSGPPGTGKSMLAKALPAILPPLSREEALEVTHLHSLASRNYEQIITERPFRAPHHSASFPAIVGGGANLRPGEISLAHRGVLFCDELPEFNPQTIEALRQPLEDRCIKIARSREVTEFPANFILVATANPCPCGYYGSQTECHCPASQVNRYQQKLSGPILDRLDLYCMVHEVAHTGLLAPPKHPTATEDIRQRIVTARRVQAKRFRSPSKLNADMTNAEIKRHARLEPGATVVLNTAARNLHLSARAYMRAIKVARTVADLADSTSITGKQMSEALSYRYQPPIS